MTSLLSAVKLNNLRQLTAEALRLSSGSMAEVGVYRGGSAQAMLEVMEKLHAHRGIYLFDTFSGLPAPGPLDAPGRSRAGQWAASLGEVMAALEPWEERVRYHVGMFPESAGGLGLERTFFSIVHVDVDLEESVRACCKWFGPRMCRGGIMVFDDYASPDWRGVKPAVDDHFGDRVQCLPPSPAVEHSQAWVRF